MCVALLFLSLLQSCAVHQEAKLPPASLGSNSQFGFSVDISGGRLVVGAPYKNNPYGGSWGVVYVFDKLGSSWVQQAVLADTKFSASNLAAFGTAVSLDGLQLAVGAPKANVTFSQGLVYIFVLQGSTWVEEAIVYPPTVTSFKNANPYPFGTSLALDGNTLLVSATGKYVGLTQYWPGVVHVYERGVNGWALQMTLQPPSDELEHSRFGWSIVLRGDTAFIGSPGDPNSTFSKTRAGEVFVFKRIAGTWTLQQRIVPNDGKLGDFFGGAMALDAKTLAVSARAIDLGQANSQIGGTYIFELESMQWKQKAKLVPHGFTPLCHSGASLVLSGDTLLLGATGGLDGTLGGVFYLFTRKGGQWYEMLKVPPPDGKPADNFGFSLAMDGTTVVVGSPWHDELGGDAGAVYVYGLDTSNLVPTYFCRPKDDPPCLPRIIPFGEPSVSGALAGIKCEIWGLEVAPASTGILCYSTKGPANTPFAGGTSCLAAPIVRTRPLPPGPSTSPCGGWFRYDFNERIESGADPALQAGQQVWFQYWYWDPASLPPSNLGLTGGATAVICP
jgi:hypothetical protein